jgi:hypothetical protein
MKKMKELPPEEKRRTQKEFEGYERARKWVLNRYGNYTKESLSSDSNFSAEGTSIADISRLISPSPTSSEAGSPPPASSFKEKTRMRGER